jgi:hypothetical protein
MVKVSKSTSLTTKFKRCYKIKGSVHFQAVFKFHGKQIYVGVFDSLLKAAIAADYRCVDLGFQKAKLNFPNKYQIYKTAIQNEKHDNECNTNTMDNHDIFQTRPHPAVVGRKIFKGGFAQKKSRNKTGYKGVFPIKKTKSNKNKKYLIQVWHQGKALKVKNNRFDTILEAAIEFDIQTISKTNRGKEYLNFPENYEDYLKQIRVRKTSNLSNNHQQTSVLTSGILL